MSNPRGPLAGVTILAVEQFGAGPFGSLFLADLGAEVIKIEQPSSGGDVGRYVPPGQDGTSSLYFETFNRGKASMSLDLKLAEGRAIFETLVSTSDAVFSNLRGDQAERLGLTYERLGHINPLIVCVALSGYGPKDSERTGYDALVQAEAGWASLTGDPSGPPTRSGLSLVDYIGGLVAALGLVAAIHDAHQSGRGGNVETNLYDCAVSMLAYQATWAMTAGIDLVRQPDSAHPSIVPFQFFETADGHVAVACAKEKFYRSLVQEMGLPELADDPDYIDFDARRTNREALIGILGDAFRSQSTDHWIDLLSETVPISPVRQTAEVVDPEALRRRGILAEYDHPTFGTVRSVGLPMTWTEYTPTYRPGPDLGADTARIMEASGYSKEQIERLAAAGAFGTTQLAEGD